jgi:hypothetical protein
MLQAGPCWVLMPVMVQSSSSGWVASCIFATTMVAQMKPMDQSTRPGGYLVEHGLRQHLAEQVGRVGQVIGGARSWSLAVLGRCVARNRRAVEVNDGLERTTIRREPHLRRRRNAEA